MDKDHSHLSMQCREIITLPDTKRVHYIHEDKWVNHDIGSQIRNKIKSSLFLPRNSQATCMIVVGVGGAGKSSLLDRVIKDCDSLAQRQGTAPPYIEIRLSPEPTLANNIKTLCEQFGVSVTQVRKDTLPIQLALLIKARGVKGLLIDEFNHLLALNRVEMRKNLNFFKILSGPPMSLDIIGFGTHEALNAINMDIQLSSRFQIFELEQWRHDEEFRSFLASYEKFIPLHQPSNLASRDIMNFLTAKIESTTRNVVNRLKWAAMLAIVEGTEKIDLDNLGRANTLPDILSVYEHEQSI